MIIRPEISTLLDAVERHAGRRFQNRGDLEVVLDLCWERKQLRDDLLFYAKFAANAYQILHRAGVETDDTEKLSQEFAKNLEKAHELLRTAVKEAPEDVKSRFVNHYLSLSQGGVTHLIELFRELAWVKNYAIDHKGLE